MVFVSFNNSNFVVFTKFNVALYLNPVWGVPKALIHDSFEWLLLSNRIKKIYFHFFIYLLFKIKDNLLKMLKICCLLLVEQSDITISLILYQFLLLFTVLIVPIPATTGIQPYILIYKLNIIST